MLQGQNSGKEALVATHVKPADKYCVQDQIHFCKEHEKELHDPAKEKIFAAHKVVPVQSTVFRKLKDELRR